MRHTDLAFAWTVARRELRGGLAGFRVFLACLILGVAGIAAVGSVTAAIQRGLEAEGQTVLGGDVALRFSYRSASAEERAWMDSRGNVAEMVTMRSMLVKGEERILAEVKGVDGSYPLYGEAPVSQGTLTEALSPTGTLRCRGSTPCPRRWAS